MEIRIRRAVLLGSTLLAVGCTDLERVHTPTAPAALTTGASSAQLDEKTALTELTRAVALALQDQGLRQRIKNDLRDSRHTVEHKLHFSNYLKGQSGGILLTKMAKESGKSRDEIHALLARVRPLEFYMPVREQRESWRGGDALWVGSYLEDDGSERPAVYDVRGNLVPLWAPDALPSTPTLALVPVETNFAKELDPARFVNKNDQDGETIGTYSLDDGSSCDGETAIVECDSGGGGGGGGGGTITPGLYMTFAYGNEGVPDGTWGLKGEPEIEMHIIGASTTDPTNAAATLSCSHAGAYGSYRFDMNDHYWSGNVLLYSQQEIDSYYSRTGDDFTVQMWEDDDGTCKIKTDKDLTDLLRIIWDVYQSNAIKISPTGVSIDWGKLIKVTWENASWLLSNDDFVGNARKPNRDEYWPHTDATHQLQRKAYDNNGRIKLVQR